MEGDLLNKIIAICLIFAIGICNFQDNALMFPQGFYEAFLAQFATLNLPYYSFQNTISHTGVKKSCASLAKWGKQIFYSLLDYKLASPTKLTTVIWRLFGNSDVVRMALIDTTGGDLNKTAAFF